MAVINKTKEPQHGQKNLRIEIFYIYFVYQISENDTKHK